MLTVNPLLAAYHRTDLQRYGITFEAAMLSPTFVKCFQRIADATQNIKQPPLPKHKTAVHWQDFKD